MHTATFVLSTGRCGTQWLASKLASGYPDLLAVEHEPLHNGYQPRLLLGLRTPLNLDAAFSRAVLDHVSTIEDRLESGDYVECGHPCWSTLPYLAERFASRIRIIHLTRHPVPTALSWLTHCAYEAPLLPHLREKVLLSPFDEGVCFAAYRDRWASMSAFEKCLYYWAEVNQFGLRMEEASTAPWLRVAFEDLFVANGLSRVLNFLDLPERPSITKAKQEVIDQHRFKSASGLPDLALLQNHDRILEVATRLGYSTSWADLDGLRQRYVLPGF